MAITTIAVIGTLVSTYGQLQQGQAAQAQSNYQSELAMRDAQVAENNAQMAEERGKEAKRIGWDNSQRKRLEVAGIVGAQRAAAGASGAQAGEGSFLDLELDTAEKGELDALNLYEQGQQEDYNKRLEAWNFREQGAGSQAKAAGFSSQANNTIGHLTTGVSLLNSALQQGRNYDAFLRKNQTRL